jgi:hypothetical protein
MSGKIGETLRQAQGRLWGTPTYRFALTHQAKQPAGGDLRADFLRLLYNPR